ncbi:antitoxin [Agrococcus lahaulensis]|uniref:antitoxin n=1 Tax=Agrococcus lahaulensis TaxID=341722 RepID=UPI00047D1A54|nr:antitoxin [Agrococcus lahaulensis]
MGLDDLANKGKEAMGGEQGEQMSDKGIDGAGDAFDKATGDRFAEHTDKAQESADGAVGQDGRQ